MWPWQHRARFGYENTSRSGSKPRPAVFLSVALAVSFGIGAAHNRWQADGKPDPILYGVQGVAFPFQIVGTRTRNVFQSVWDGFTAGPRMAQENARLKTELLHAQEEANTLRAKAAEADRLADALGFAKTQKQPPLAAEIIGLLPSPHVETITMDRGLKDGIKPRAIVRTPAGMVGQVMEVGPLSSQVLLLTDVKSRIHVTVQRSGKPLPLPSYGIVQGAGRGLPLKVLYLKREDDIRPGDTLVSTGFGGAIPPDLVIGTVQSVAEGGANSNYLKSATITPATPQPGDLREAYILR